MVRNVLVALDESQASRAALDYALRGVLPRPAGAANLHLVTVLPTVQTPIAGAHADMPTAEAAGAQAAATAAWQPGRGRGGVVDARRSRCRARSLERRRVGVRVWVAAAGVSSPSKPCYASKIAGRPRGGRSESNRFRGPGGPDGPFPESPWARAPDGSGSPR
eukprot:353082-Chlamydomonas_euryale.AAC.3